MVGQTIIIGAGGHAKIVMSTLIALGEKIAGFVDDNPDLINTYVHGYPVFPSDYLRDTPHDAIIGIGNNEIRKEIAARYSFLNWRTIVHPTAIVHPSVKIGKGTIICAGAIIQIDSLIGDHVIVNTAASIDHDCHVHNFAHIAPGTRFAGGVKVGEGCFIGINCCAIYGQIVGDWTTVGAGSVIVRPIESSVYAKGAPAKAYKKKSPTPLNNTESETV